MRDTLLSAKTIFILSIYVVTYGTKVLKEYAFLSYDKNVFLRAKKIVCKKSYKYKNCFRIYKYIINYYYCKYLFTSKK